MVGFIVRVVYGVVVSGRLAGVYGSVRGDSKW